MGAEVQLRQETFTTLATEWKIVTRTGRRNKDAESHLKAANKALFPQYEDANSSILQIFTKKLNESTKSCPQLELGIGTGIGRWNDGQSRHIWKRKVKMKGLYKLTFSSKEMVRIQFS